MFTAKWCGPCQAMKRNILQDSTVVDILSDYEFIYCDIDTKAGSVLKRRYLVNNGIPEFVVIDFNERVIATQKGASSDKAQFIEFLRKWRNATAKKSARKPIPKNTTIISYYHDGSIPNEKQLVIELSKNSFLNEKFEFKIIDRNVDTTIIDNTTEISDKPKIEFWLADSKHYISKRKHKKYVKGNTPVFIVRDSTLNPYIRHQGKITPDDLIDLIESGEKNYNPRKYKESIYTLTPYSELESLLYSTYNMKFKPSFNFGMNYSNLTDNYAHYKLGYDAGIMFTYLPKKNNNDLFFQTGLQFSSVGGKQSMSSENLRINYIELPVNLSYKIFNHTMLGNLCPQPFRIGIMPYLACGVGAKEMETKTRINFGNKLDELKRWDYGFKMGIDIETGSFQFFGGYKLGIADISNNPNTNYYNRGFYLGTSLVLGY